MTSESATTTHLLHERPFRVLRHRDFRLIWSADFLSQTGTQVQRVAVAWQVFQMTHDPLQLGLLGLARFVPLFLFGLAGGVLADRYDRRKMLILAELALATIAASFTWLTAVDRINMVWIFALTALSATFGAVAGPTRQALVPALVPRPSMPAAMTMDVLTFQAAGMVGPAIGGALVASSGIAVSYAVDAVTFAGVVLAALALQARPRQAKIVGGGWEAAREGLRFLRETPVLLGTMALDFLANFFGASTTLMPIFAADVLGGGPGMLGLLLAAPAVGAVSGATILASARALSRPGLGILGAVVVYGLALAGFAFSTNLWLSLVLLAVSGVADSVSVSQRHTLRNMVTPDRLRGRISAAHSTFAGGGPQLGEFEAGIVASLTSAPIAVAVGGLGTVAAAAVIARRVPGLIGLRWRVADAHDETPNRGATRPIVATSIDGSGPGSI